MLGPFRPIYLMFKSQRLRSPDSTCWSDGTSWRMTMGPYPLSTSDYKHQMKFRIYAIEKWTYWGVLPGFQHRFGERLPLLFVKDPPRRCFPGRTKRQRHKVPEYGGEHGRYKDTRGCVVPNPMPALRLSHSRKPHLHRSVASNMPCGVAHLIYVP
jgi:hypothetical protein